MHGHGPSQDWDAVPPAPHAAAPPAWPGPVAPAPYPGYGPGWPVPGAQGAWPAEPGRPGLATTAAVLGFVTAGLTLLMCLFFVVNLATGFGDGPTGILLFGIPAAGGLITGGVRLLGGHSPAVLFGSGLASVAVLALAWLVGLGTLSGDSLLGLTSFVVMALPLPVLTAVFAWVPSVRRWVDG